MKDVNKLTKFLIFWLILILIGTSFTSIAEQQNNPEETKGIIEIPMNRFYFTAQVYGEINISETFNYKKSIIPDTYRNIKINGTVINSTLLDPFSIWPPISLIPFLRMVFLTDGSPVNLSILWFKGKFYTRDNETKVRLYGEGYFVIIKSTLILNWDINTRHRV